MKFEREIGQRNTRNETAQKKVSRNLRNNKTIRKMATYKNKYRGMTIHVTDINKDRVDYKITKSDGSLVDGTESYCVTVDEAMETCKEIIDDILDA